METLPEHGGNHGRASGFEPGVIVSGDVGDAAQATSEEALEGSPVNFGFAQNDADAEQDALTLGTDARGDFTPTPAQVASSH